MSEEKEQKMKEINQEAEERNCEHKLCVTDENWISEGTVMITLECGKCNTKFEGLCIKK